MCKVLRVHTLILLHIGKTALLVAAMEEEGDAGPFEEFGVLRLPLKPGTASGYVGVQRSGSKKRPWQATLKIPARKRLGESCVHLCDGRAMCVEQSVGSVCAT